MTKYIKAIVVVFLLVCLDQYTKSIVISHLDLYTYYPVLGNAFGLYYLENKGMAWGMLQNHQIGFLIFTVIILLILGYCYIRLSKNLKFLPLNICILFLVSGAIGNMLDRIFHGEQLFQGAVVDFLDIKLIHFPVFNVADIFVTLSIIVGISLILFRYRDTNFEEILLWKNKNKRKKNEELNSGSDASLENSQKPVDLDSFFVNEEEEDD